MTDFHYKLLKLLDDNSLADYVRYYFDEDDIVYYVDATEYFPYDGYPHSIELDEPSFNLLKQTIQDCHDIHFSLTAYAVILFCCRQARQKPIQKYYTDYNKEMWHLFDECEKLNV